MLHKGYVVYPVSQLTLANLFNEKKKRLKTHRARHKYKIYGV